MDTEDRELFVEKLDEINVKTIKSEACENMEQTRKAAAEPGIRSLSVLRMLGGFRFRLRLTMKRNSTSSLRKPSSPQVLVEKSLKGWKEIE